MEATGEPYLLAVLFVLLLAVAFSSRWGAGALSSLGRLLRSPLTPSAPVPSSFSGRAYIVDGDTLIVGRTRVRMFGMDAPELSQRGGYKAKSRLIGLAGGKTVSVHPVTIDCYGRTVARVRFGDIDLSDQMVRDGFARATSRWNSDYDAAEFEARRDQRGLWYGDPSGGIRDPATHRRWKRKDFRF